MPAYSERYVAFIDVLGTSSLLLASTTDEILARRAAALATVMADHVPVWQRLRTTLEGPERESADRLTNLVRGYAFSDHIALSAAPDWKGLGILLDNTITLLRKFLLHGMLCRGGLVRGLLHEQFDELSVITGPALLSAHAIENKVAVYPRVVLSPEVVGDCAEYIHPVGRQPFDREYLAVDAKDEKTYIDYLPSPTRRRREETIFQDPLDGEKSFLAAIRDELAQQVDEARQRPDEVRVLENLEWFAAYFNRRAAEIGLEVTLP